MVLSDLKIKLAQFEEELEQTQTAIKTIMTDKQTTPIDHVYCYFTQSIMINEQAKENVLIIGSLHIHNKSIHNKKDPTILIKITADTNFHFIGKFKSAKQEQQNFTFQWERLDLDHLDPHNHYCFKPTETKELLSQGQLSFQNFQLKVPVNTELTIEGFTYFDGQNEGVAALNSINLNA
ncbi:MAG TPA: hypothetical protein VK044_09580 [Virgibacillus sp.]|nr:hypothetical protein [Virgibacillus sp.]